MKSIIEGTTGKLSPYNAVGGVYSFLPFWGVGQGSY